MAAWIYKGNVTQQPLVQREKKAWYIPFHRQPKFIATPRDKDPHVLLQQLKPNDTIFCPYSRLRDFTTNFLPRLHIDIVLITTPYAIKVYPDWVEPLARNITQHAHVLAWFATNIGNYTGGYQYHPKVHPFPLGLRAIVGPTPKRMPVPYYRKAFVDTYYNPPNKTTHLYANALGQTNKQRRLIVPRPGPQVEYTVFLKELAASHYVFSPNGDHGDCHRHYEAIGMGAVPVTHLDKYLYSHLREGNTVYNTTEFNMTRLAQQLEIPAEPGNRNMVFEEFWMEYVEAIVGRPLWWWDVNANRRSLLVHFQNATRTPPMLPRET